MSREQRFRCPIDGQRLDEWTCPAGHRFPVVDGVPRLVAGDDQAGTAESFGSKWAATPAEERRWLSAFQFEWYDQRFGWGGERGLDPAGEILGLTLDLEVVHDGVETLLPDHREQRTRGAAKEESARGTARCRWRASRPARRATPCRRSCATGR